MILAPVVVIADVGVAEDSSVLSTFELFSSSSVEDDPTLVAASSSSSSPNSISISTLAESSEEHEDAAGDGSNIVGSTTVGS